MAVNRMTGTSWHVENMHRKEGDSKRHKTKCAYYQKVSFCTRRNGKCIGSAHCLEYRELDLKDRKNTKKDKEDFYYL